MKEFKLEVEVILSKMILILFLILKRVYYTLPCNFLWNMLTFSIYFFPRNTLPSKAWSPNVIFYDDLFKYCAGSLVPEQLGSGMSQQTAQLIYATCRKHFITGKIRVGSLLLFDDNKIKMARKPGKKQKENPVGCTGESKK